MFAGLNGHNKLIIVDTDDELRLQFEAISGFDAQEKQIIREVLEGLILKHEAKRWATTS